MLTYQFWVQEQSGQVINNSTDSQSDSRMVRLRPSATDRWHGRVSEERHQNLCGRNGRALYSRNLQPGSLTFRKEAEKGVRMRT